MLDPKQFLEYVVQPALRFLEPEIPHTRAAERLLMGTALMETGLTYLVQIGGGPALGIFQMEPQTHDDIWDHFLQYRQALSDKIERRFGDACGWEELTTDLLYGAVMARIHYWRVPDALPGGHDIAELAAYWKAHYNTPQGHGTPHAFYGIWQANKFSDLWPEPSVA